MTENTETIEFTEHSETRRNCRLGDAVIAVIGKPRRLLRLNVVRFGDLHRACSADRKSFVSEEGPT
jgi:hypothetical protein